MINDLDRGNVQKRNNNREFAWNELRAATHPRVMRRYFEKIRLRKQRNTGKNKLSPSSFLPLTLPHDIKLISPSYFLRLSRYFQLICVGNLTYQRNPTAMSSMSWSQASHLVQRSVSCLLAQLTKQTEILWIHLDRPHNLGYSHLCGIADQSTPQRRLAGIPSCHNPDLRILPRPGSIHEKRKIIKISATNYIERGSAYDRSVIIF